MSNHSGSYMLNEVLQLLEKEAAFKFWGRTRTQEIALKIVQIGHDYSCGSGEILEDIGARIGLCYACHRQTNSMADSVKPAMEKDFYRIRMLKLDAVAL